MSKLTQPVRFIVAGAAASLLNWLVRIGLSEVVPFSPAVVLAYCLGMVFGFFLYRTWVFGGTALPIRSQVYRFVFVNALGLAVVVVSAQALLAVTEQMRVGPTEAVAHAIAIALGGLTNFLGHRGLTFAKVRSADLAAARSPPR